MRLYGAAVGSIPWTAEEDAVLRESYPAGGVYACLAALPGRTKQTVWWRARKLDLARRPVWTEKQHDELRQLWAESTPLKTIASRFSRSEYGVYHKAQELGLTAEPPRGCSRLSDAAREAGVTTATLRRILAWAGRRVRAVAGRPKPNAKTSIRWSVVDWIDLEEAVKAWCAAEPVNAAARRIGISGAALRNRLKKAGVEFPGNHRQLRVTDAQLAAAAAAVNVKGDDRRG